jgi:hypothetical protein
MAFPACSSSVPRTVRTTVKIPEQLRRLSVLLGAVLVVILLLRFVAIPQAYFSSPIHQASTVRREAAKPLVYAGMATCRECHQDVYETKSAGYHKNVNCETCHDAAAQHAADPMTVKPGAPRDRSFCPVCHAYDPARPTGFPQINTALHNPGLACITCHSPHDPVPPEVPHDCSACHAQIWNTKAVSAHAILPCTTCHTVAEEHKIQPRSNLPSKPQAREFCGTCHAAGEAAGRVPQIDLASHGGNYLCWQCHYPHLPEGR